METRFIKVTIVDEQTTCLIRVDSIQGIAQLNDRLKESLINDMGLSEEEVLEASCILFKAEGPVPISSPTFEELETILCS